MLKVFAVFDVKAAAFGAPQFMATRGLAMRAFAEASADARSPLAQYPADYSLYELGEYDPATGMITSLPQPSMLVSAAAIIQERELQRKSREPELSMKVEEVK